MFVHNAPSDSSSSQTTPSLNNTPASRSQAASEDVPIRPGAYKTRPCRFYAKGRCTAGEQCRWSHDENLIQQEEAPPPEITEDDFLAPGYKLVPKSYRTQPMRDIGPSPPQLVLKSHSTQHSPAISSLHAPGIRSSISAATPPPSSAGAILSAPTRPRELPPPQSQSHYSGIDWSVPSIASPATPSKGGTATPPVFASSPLITAGQAPPMSRSNSLILQQDHQALPSPLLTNGVNGHIGGSSQARSSPFLFTFGEIGPGSAMNSPRGLGLNGANLAPHGAVSTGNVTATSPLSARLGSPSLASVSALGTTGINVIRQKSRLSTATDVYPNDDDPLENVDAETEPDFPTINYNALGDLATEPDEDDHLHHNLHDDRGFNGNSNGVSGGMAVEDGIRSGYLTPNGYGGLNGNGGYSGGQVNGMSEYSASNGGAYERDWGIALNALNGAPTPIYGAPPQSAAYNDGYGSAFKTRACKFYVAGSRCPAGQNCTFIHDPEAFRRSSTTHAPHSNFSSPPIPPEMHPLYRTRECKYHLAGRCHQEGTCAFKHTGPPGQGREYENWEGFSIQVNDHEGNAEDRGGYRSRPACIFFQNGAGNCINGDDCRFSHDIYPEEDASYVAGNGTDSGEGDYSQQVYGFEVSVPSERHPTQIMDQYNIAPEVVSTIAEEEEYVPQEEHQHHYNEPYFGGIGGLVNGMEGLTVGPRMELVVSEGEEEEEEDDIVVLRPSGGRRSDPTSQDVEKLFETSPI
ncbi:hypothetical protein FRB96_006010 [Tulasnella sp. 330]|nr:hypothetical protein FRB96_006010 [Tulasnella sp. 330]